MFVGGKIVFCLHEQPGFFVFDIVHHDIDVTGGCDIGEAVGNAQHGIRNVCFFVEVHDADNGDSFFLSQLR